MPRRQARESMRAISASDSQLKLRMPSSRACSISARVLPTPEKMTRDGSAAGPEDAEEFAAADDVEAGASAREEAKNAEISVGFHCVADAVGDALERGIVGSVTGRGWPGRSRRSREYPIFAAISARSTSSQNSRSFVIGEGLLHVGVSVHLQNNESLIIVDGPRAAKPVEVGEDAIGNFLRRAGRRACGAWPGSAVWSVLLAGGVLLIRDSVGVEDDDVPGSRLERFSSYSTCSSKPTGTPAAFRIEDLAVAADHGGQ